MHGSKMDALLVECFYSCRTYKEILAKLECDIGLKRRYVLLLHYLIITEVSEVNVLVAYQSSQIGRFRTLYYVPSPVRSTMPTHCFIR